MKYLRGGRAELQCVRDRAVQGEAAHASGALSTAPTPLHLRVDFKDGRGALAWLHGFKARHGVFQTNSEGSLRKLRANRGGQVGNPPPPPASLKRDCLVLWPPWEVPLVNPTKVRPPRDEGHHRGSTKPGLNPPDLHCTQTLPKPLTTSSSVICCDLCAFNKFLIPGPAPPSSSSTSSSPSPSTSYTSSISNSSVSHCCCCSAASFTPPVTLPPSPPLHPLPSSLLLFLDLLLLFLYLLLLLPLLLYLLHLLRLQLFCVPLLAAALPPPPVSLLPLPPTPPPPHPLPPSLLLFLYLLLLPLLLYPHFHFQSPTSSLHFFFVPFNSSYSSY